MTLPRAYALFGYWSEWPPVHEAMRVAWFKSEKRTDAATPAVKEEKNTQTDVAAFTQIPGVGAWRGPPPFNVADVERLNAELKAKQNGG